MIENQNTVKLLLKPRAQKIIERAFEVFDLNSVDYYTLIDLLEYSRLTSDEELENLTVILICLFSSLKDGSLCLRLNEDVIKNKLVMIIDNEQDSERIISDFLNDIEKYEKLISINKDEYKPVVYREFEGQSYLYFQKYYTSEEKLQEKVHKLLSDIYDADPAKIDKEIINIINTSNLNDKQKLAVFLALIKNFIIISGGPGTGKTFLIFWLLKVLVKNGCSTGRIGLAAPTGRAAERLTESVRSLLRNEDDEIKELLISIEGKTIHRLLKYSSYKNDFRYNEKNKLPLDVLIIDEVSMVDINLMTKLLSALKDDVKMIFLGDKDQLPSVEAGAVLADLIPHYFEESFSALAKNINSEIKPALKQTSMTDRIVILNKNYRSKGSSYKFALNINNQNEKIIDDLPRLTFDNYLDQKVSVDSNCFFIEHENVDLKSLRSLLEIWLDKYFFNEKIKYLSWINDLSKTVLNANDQNELLFRIFKIINRTKILAILKEGLFGVSGINSIIETLFQARTKHHNRKYFSGMPIIITKNNYSLKLFNGDTGIIIKDKNEIYNAVFYKSDSFVIIPVNFLHSFDSAFSITVHKSQGSEYDDVLLILPDKKENPLLTKELLYTGITRAKESVVIYGKNDVFKKAVSCRIQRESGLNLWKG